MVLGKGLKGARASSKGFWLVGFEMNRLGFRGSRAHRGLVVPLNMVTRVVQGPDPVTRGLEPPVQGFFTSLHCAKMRSPLVGSTTLLLAKAPTDGIRTMRLNILLPR